MTTEYFFADSQIEPINYLTLIADVEASVREDARTLLTEGETTFTIFTVLDCGCYTCETGLSAGPVNEGGQGECMAGYEFINIMVDGDQISMVTVYSYVDYMRTK